MREKQGEKKETEEETEGRFFFFFLTKSKKTVENEKQKKQGIVGVALLDAEGRIIRESGDVRFIMFLVVKRRKDENKISKRSLFFVFLPANPCFPQPRQYSFSKPFPFSFPARRLRPCGTGGAHAGLPREGHGPRRRRDGKEEREKRQRREMKDKKNVFFSLSLFFFRN